MAYNYVERAVATESHPSAQTAKRSRPTRGKGAFRRRRVGGQCAALLRADAHIDQTRSLKLIGIIVFDQMTAADLMGPAEVFSRPTRVTDTGREDHCYQVVAIGVSAEPCVTESGIIVKPHVDMQHAPQLDTVIVPGGRGIQNPKLDKQIADWLNSRARVSRRIAALGTGIYAIAPTGLLDGRQVVTHWRLTKDLASRFPKLAVTSDRLFVRDGPFYTCAGGASVIDLSLSLIEEDYGRQVALKLAQELVVHLKRSGEQEQYSEALQFQVQSSDRLADITTWILCNLNTDLSVEALAQRACMSPRNFTRLFKIVFGASPAEFVTRARITEARRRLEVPRNNIDSVAASVGFQSADAFSRAFERQTGIRPRTYRTLRKASARKVSAQPQPGKWAVKPMLLHIA